MKLKLTTSQSKIIEIIQKEGKIWIVGGAVRDVSLGKTPKDIDFATNLTTAVIKSIVLQHAFCWLPDQKAEEHGIIRVVDKDTGEFIDIATLRRDVSCDGRYAKVKFTTSLREDLARRDLTINAMAAEVHPNGEVSTLHDHHGGQADIQSKTIRFVGNSYHRMEEDALRAIRACRFTALGEDWRIATPDFWAIHDVHATEKELFDGISKERIRDEFIKALTYSCPGNFIRYLNSSKLLVRVCRPLTHAIGVEQNEYHNEEVFVHLMASLDAMCELSNDPLLRLAALLHDIGKPATLSTDSDGRTHFFRHEVEGASIAYNWMREFKFCNKDVEYISKLIRHHQWRFEEHSRDKTIRRWLQKVGRDCWRDLITLRMADRRGNFAKKDKPMMTTHMLQLQERAQKIIDDGDACFKEDLNINGHDLKALGIPPGPIYKEIFSNILGIVIQNPERNTKLWLTDFVQKNYIKENK